MLLPGLSGAQHGNPGVTNAEAAETDARRGDP
jgi:hypothetical protein